MLARCSGHVVNNFTVQRAVLLSFGFHGGAKPLLQCFGTWFLAVSVCIQSATVAAILLLYSSLAAVNEHP